MALEKIEGYFNSIMESYDERLQNKAGGAEEYFKNTITAIPKDENLHIADLGSGTGMELHKLLAENNTLRVTAIDCAEKMQARFRERFSKYGERVQPVTKDFFDFDFGFSYFDGAIAVMSMHYYKKEEKLALYKRICRGIKTGGFLIVTDQFAPTQNYEDFCRSQLERKIAAEHADVQAHYHFDVPLTVANEAAILFKAGFSDVRVHWAKGSTAVLRAIK